jgi:hemerythrin-like metal-binding protein
VPNRVPWDPDFSVGHDVIDAEHQSLLDQCNLLADHCVAADGEESARRFDQVLERLKAIAREHFATEALVLASGDVAALEDHRIECDEFEYLVGEVATTEKFDRSEVQRFLGLWCVGHITGSARELRALLAGGNASA